MVLKFTMLHFITSLRKTARSTNIPFDPRTIIAEMTDVAHHLAVTYRLLHRHYLRGDKPFDLVHWCTPRFEVFPLEEGVLALRGFVVGFARGDIDYRVAPQRHGERVPQMVYCSVVSGTGNSTRIFSPPARWSNKMLLPTRCKPIALSFT